jgi:uncharacterized protein YxeA
MLIYICVLILIILIIYWCKKKPNNFDKINYMMKNNASYEEFKNEITNNPFLYFELRQLYDMKKDKVRKSDYDYLLKKYD